MKWPSRLWSNLSSCKVKPWKNSGLQRDSNPWPLGYRSGALTTELWSFRTGIPEVMGSNPVEALNFFQGFTLQLLKLLHNRDGHFIFIKIRIYTTRLMYIQQDPYIYNKIRIYTTRFVYIQQDSIYIYTTRSVYIQQDWYVYNNIRIYTTRYIYIYIYIYTHTQQDPCIIYKWRSKGVAVQIDCSGILMISQACCAYPRSKLSIETGTL